MHKVAIVGASGYAGAELLRLCASHPDLDVVAASAERSAGKAVAAVHPHLGAAYPQLTFDHYSPDLFDGVDVTFLALPHGASQRLVPELLEHSKRVIDLAGDFRFQDDSVYKTWYVQSHAQPDMLGDFVYGLPELFREDIAGATAVAVAGCYVTAASIALAPLVATGAVDGGGIVVDAASGVSGAGKNATAETAFATVDASFAAYGLVGHRHTPEMEMALTRHAGVPCQILFTPHLAPMSRGILATCYARTANEATTDEVLSALEDAYAAEPFVRIVEHPPATKATLGSNNVEITARVDPRTGWTIVIAALDNVVKGAAGQAIQCANIILGLPEQTGLPLTGVSP